MRRILFLLIFGLGGLAILLSLGFWQLQRLEWKETILAGMDARLAADPIALPENPTEAADEFQAVALTGTPVGTELHVLSSGTKAGTGYRVISLWDVEGRRIMVDMGVMSLQGKGFPIAMGEQTILGNLLWPDDAFETSPAPDLEKNIWYARSAPEMAQVLGAEPFMVVLRTTDNPDPRLVPVPVDTSGIKNDHREYAITWFLLALVWALMSGYFVFRPMSGGTTKKD